MQGGSDDVGADDRVGSSAVGKTRETRIAAKEVHACSREWFVSVKRKVVEANLFSTRSCNVIFS